MRKNIKHDVRKKARIAAGIVNLLKDDVEHLRVDANDFDIICLEESVRDTKNTIQMLMDNVTEIEYLLYLFNSNDAC